MKFNNKLFFLFWSFTLLLPNIVLAKIPNDPLVDQWSYKTIGLYNAWDYITGDGNVIVAIIDNGFDYLHNDLKENVWKNIDEVPDNGIDDDNNGYIDDVWGWNFVPVDVNQDGDFSDFETKGNNDPRPDVSNLNSVEKNEEVYQHGTVVAGIIGAVGNNYIDGAGVNWHVKLMNVKVLDNSGIGSLIQLPNAIRYAVDNGADIINISMVGDDDSDNSIQKAIDYAYQKGAVIVAAAGNNYGIDLDFTPRYPICSDMADDEQKIIGVSAINENRYLANFSNIGSSCVDITAPGVGIKSTLLYSPDNELKDSYTQKGWNGTSFATPFVSGAAALIKSIRPEWNNKKIYEALLLSVHHTPSDNEDFYTKTYGWGLLQVDKAIKYASENLSAGNISLKKSKVNPPQDEITFDIKIDSPDETDDQIKNKNLRRINIISLTNGKTQKMESFSNKDLVENKIAVRRSSIITSFVDNDKNIKYVVAKGKKGGSNIITIYDENWKVWKRFTVKISGKTEVVVGDFFGDSEYEVVIANLGSDKNLVYIYDFTGKLLQKIDLADGHNGVRLDVYHNLNNDKDELVVAYKKNNQVGLKYFVEDFGKLKEQTGFMLKDIKGLVDLKMFDLNSDSKGEFILSYNNLRRPKVSIIDLNEKIINSFYPFGSGYYGGANLAVFDYDYDNLNDIIVSPDSSGEPIRVLNMKGKLITESWPFGEEKDNGNVFVLYLF